MEDKSRARVALTLEQFWHRVPGGTAVAAAGMVQGLRTLDAVDVVGVAARHASAPGDPSWIDGVAIERFGLPRLALYESWHRLRRPAIESITGAVNVIHATTIAMPPRTVPLVVTIHDLAFRDDPEKFTRRGLQFFERGLELALEDADLVHCPSEATRHDCLDAGFSGERVRVVPLGIAARPVDDAEVAAVRSRYALNDPYLLWVGTIEPRKNLKGLVDAFVGSGVERTLVLVGPEGWGEDLATLLAPVRDRTKALGFVPRRDLDALYAGADAFCWPSFKEGFGFPVLEAMAQGTPVITSRGTSTEELAGDAALLVDPHSPDEIADAIVSLVQDEALARKLSEAGRERVKAFSWATTARGLVDMYKEIA